MHNFPSALQKNGTFAAVSPHQTSAGYKVECFQPFPPHAGVFLLVQNLYYSAIRISTLARPLVELVASSSIAGGKTPARVAAAGPGNQTASKEDMIRHDYLSKYQIARLSVENAWI
jgi:hypothetical protein